MRGEEQRKQLVREAIVYRVMLSRDGMETKKVIKQVVEDLSVYNVNNYEVSGNISRVVKQHRVKLNNGRLTV